MIVLGSPYVAIIPLLQGWGGVSCTRIGSPDLGLGFSVYGHLQVSHALSGKPKGKLLLVSAEGLLV